MFFIASSDGQLRHQCFVFEPLGPSLLEFVAGRKKKVFHIAEVRWMAIYFLTALDFLHTHHVVHTGRLSLFTLRDCTLTSLADLKLDNILLTLPDNESEILECFIETEKVLPSRVKSVKDGHLIYESRLMPQRDVSFPIICDLGSAVLGDFQHKGLASALPYRAPEVILGATWNSKIDIWSIGVVVRAALVCIPM
jgi:serine/threonine protein kinase